MNSRESAEIKMINSFGIYLQDNGIVFSGDNVMMKLKLTFDTQSGKLILLSKSLINEGDYSQEKRNSKYEMADYAANLAGFAEVCFKGVGKTLEASQMHISVSDYMKKPDVEAGTLGQTVYDVLFNNKDILCPDYVKEDELIELQSLIDTYKQTQGTSLSAHQTSPVNTQAFKATLKEVHDTIHSIRLMARRYKKSNNDFYNKLIAESTAPVVHVHHTGLSLTVTKGTNNEPVANAQIVLNGGNKTGKTNEEGFFGFDSVKAGTSQLIIKAVGCKDSITSISIARGKDNHFDIHLETV